MTSPLENLCGPGQPLRKEAPDAKEFAGLERSGLTRLADAQNEANSLESRFDLAYNAAHALCLAALRRSGYRSANRYIVFQVLPHTLGLGPEVWRVLARCHDVQSRSVRRRSVNRRAPAGRLAQGVQDRRGCSP